MLDKQQLEILKTLKRARKLITPGYRWTQGTMSRHGYSYCAMGAIYYAATKSNTAAEAVIVLDKLAPGGSIVAFNDAKDRKHHEVLEVFDKAIQCAEAVKNQPS